MTEDIQTEELTQDQVVERLVNIYNEVLLLTEDAKVVLDDAKESGMDYKTLNKIAKAKVKGNLSDLAEQARDFVDLAEEFI